MKDNMNPPDWNAEDAPCGNCPAMDELRRKYEALKEDNAQLHEEVKVIQGTSEAYAEMYRTLLRLYGNQIEELSSYRLEHKVY